MKIMVIDDSITMRRIEILALKKSGYTDIMEAEDGELALDLLKKSIGQLPDLILLDWNMPGMSGIAVLKAIKREPALKNITVIMVTTESDKDNVLEAVNNGAAGFVVKPLTPQKFETLVIQKLKKQ
jgi:two-component system chemotaxis response regulator CheY